MERTPFGLAGEGKHSSTRTTSIQQADVNFSHPLMVRGSPDASAAPEKTNSTSYVKSLLTNSTDQKITCTVDKVTNSPAVSNPVDLQASVFGRINVPLSAITVPIRLDALSYLLNSALMGAYRIASQTPLCGNQYTTPLCQSPAPFYPSPMGQVAQTSFLGDGSHPAHFTAPVCSVPQSCPVQQQVFTGNSYPDLTRSLVSPTKNPTGNTITYSPVFKGEANAATRHASAACSTPNQISTGLLEGNICNSKTTETIVERQNHNFVQPDNFFSGVSREQNLSPKMCFVKSSFGDWENNRRGKSSSGHQQRRRSKHKFHSGKRRGDLRNKSRDSGLGGGYWNSNFCNRKRSHDQRSRLQDEGHCSRRGRWSDGKGPENRQGSWPQKFYDSQARSDFANNSKRSKCGPALTSSLSLPPSFTKNGNTGEVWETDYKQGKPKTFGHPTTKSSMSVDKRSAVTATSKAFQRSFAENDHLNEDWEIEYKSEPSSRSTSKSSLPKDQKLENRKPRSSKSNTEIAKFAFETSSKHTRQEHSKAIESVDNQKKFVKHDSALIDEFNTPESDKVEDPEKGLFEKFMAIFYSGVAVENEGFGKTAANMHI